MLAANLSPSALPAHSAFRDKVALAATVALILALTLVRLAYLAWWCPLDLAPDEAHYWDWSRHLDWSYYSKGPLVAWFIRLSCWFGGETTLAVRFPAVLCGSLMLAGLYVLTVKVYQRPWLGFAVVALAATLPVVAVGSLLMTIDAPYLCCWTWALVCVHQAIFRERFTAWFLAGLLVALGFLAKYNMVLFPASVGLFLLCSPMHRRKLRQAGFWCMTGISTLGGIPVLLWNAQNGWVSFRHVMGQAGVEGTASWHLLGPLDYLGSQAALLLGFWFVLWCVVMLRMALQMIRHNESRNETDAFLWWLSAPMFLVFLGFSLRTKIQLNWPLAAYVASMPLAASWLVAWGNHPNYRLRVLLRAGVASFVLLGLVATVLLHRTELAYPLLTQQETTNLRKWDPTCRLRGWQQLAADVQRTREQLRSEGVQPVLVTTYWNLSGEVAFYLPDHPEVYCVGRAAGGRWSQYDLWRPNPLADPEQFRGRTFILVGYLTPEMQQAFDQVSERLVEHRVYGFLVASWPISVGRGFKGFGPLREASH